MIYARSTDAELRQGEIIADLTVASVETESVGQSTISIRQQAHPFVIVLSSDCDLLQHYDAYTNVPTGQDRSPRALVTQVSSVLFCEAHSAIELRTLYKTLNQLQTETWKRARQNKEERFQFLEKVPAECDSLEQGLPAMLIDFRRHFTMPIDEVYARLDHGAVKRSRILSPYLEHFVARFYHYCARVALPQDHNYDEI